jgi:hypothetical protein
MHVFIGRDYGNPCLLFIELGCLKSGTINGSDVGVHGAGEGVQM